MFNDPGIFYFDRPSDVMFDQDWKLDSNKISKLKDHKLVIADFSSEHYGPSNGIVQWYQHLEQQGINFLMLVHDPSDHQRFNRMLYYPYWYFYSVKNFRLPKEVSINKTYSWSCLNFNPRIHRIHNYILSRSKPYFSQARFSMHDAPEEHCARLDDFVLDQTVINEWNLLRTLLPHVTDNYKLGFNLDLTIPELADSYLHVVTETIVLPRVFITEKTWKPIAMQQLFLVFGDPGTIAALRQLGVDVFDDIVDHSYDNEPEWRQRLDMVHQSLEKLLSKDLQLIYQQTKYRREQNQIRFKNKEFGLQYQQDLTSTIKQYL